MRTVFVLHSHLYLSAKHLKYISATCVHVQHLLLLDRHRSERGWSRATSPLADSAGLPECRCVCSPSRWDRYQCSDTLYITSNMEESHLHCVRGKVGAKQKLRLSQSPDSSSVDVYPTLSARVPSTQYRLPGRVSLLRPPHRPELCASFDCQSADSPPAGLRPGSAPTWRRSCPSSSRVSKGATLRCKEDAPGEGKSSCTTPAPLR